MVEISRDGKRVFVTNSLYRTWDDQFYPDGIRGWMTMLDADPSGGIRTDAGFLGDRKTSALTRFVCRAETRRRIPIASRED